MDTNNYMIPGCINTVLSKKHVLIIGKTGSGKTFWASKIAENYTFPFIFINTQEEESINQVCSVITDNIEVVLDELINEGTQKIGYIPPENDEVACVELEYLRKELFKYAEQKGVKTGSFWLNMFIDEAQTFAWKGGRCDLENFARRGRRYGIKSFFLTQRPQDISSVIINNIDFQLFFKTGDYENQYFKSYAIPLIKPEQNEKEEWIIKTQSNRNWLWLYSNEYSYFLYDGIEMQKCMRI